MTQHQLVLLTEACREAQVKSSAHPMGEGVPSSFLALGVLPLGTSEGVEKCVRGTLDPWVYRVSTMRLIAFSTDSRNGSECGLQSNLGACPRLAQATPGTLTSWFQGRERLSARNP